MIANKNQFLGLGEKEAAVLYILFSVVFRDYTKDAGTSSIPGSQGFLGLQPAQEETGS